MLKQFRTFSILTVCLFAIVIVMGGCNRDDPPPPDKPGKTEIVKPPVETPMGKLVGEYQLTAFALTLPDDTSLFPPATGALSLGSDGNWRMSVTIGDEEPIIGTGTWSATPDYMILDDGTVGSSESIFYTWDGNTLSFQQKSGSERLFFEWRRK